MAEPADPIVRRMRVIHIVVAVAFVALMVTGFNSCEWVTDEAGHTPASPPDLPLALYQIASALAIAVLLFAYSWIVSRADPVDHMRRRRTLVVMFLASILYLVFLVEGPLLVVNRAFDSSPPTARTARITKKEVSRGSRGTTTYYVMLSSWRADMDAIRLGIDEAQYHDPRFAVGKSLALTTRAGFLKTEYIVRK
jgi:hypothetical protein